MPLMGNVVDEVVSEFVILHQPLDAGIIDGLDKHKTTS